MKVDGMDFQISYTTSKSCDAIASDIAGQSSPRDQILEFTTR